MLETWVISLPHRADRLAAFDARARAAGLDYRVQPGIVPTARRGWQGSLASYGCALAHRAILARGRGDVLIFEDDALVDPGLVSRLRAGLAALEPGWEVLLVGAGELDYADAPGRLVRRARSWHQTHAYAVSAAGRARVLGANRDAVWHWDHEFAAQLRGATWALSPSIGQDPALGSDIRAGAATGCGCCCCCAPPPTIVFSKLRLSQRNDGRGIVKFPRLRASVGTSTAKGDPDTVRVGDVNRLDGAWVSQETP